MLERIFACLIAAAVLSTPGWAAGRRSGGADRSDFEITSSLSPAGIGGILGQSGPYGGANFLFGASSATLIGLGAGLGIPLNAKWEFMFNPSLTLVSVTNTATVFAITAGPLYNFKENWEDSFFFFAGPGLLLASGGGSTSTSFQFTVALGKRFPLGSHFSYSPMISYTGITNGYTSNLGIVPAQFSIFI